MAARWFAWPLRHPFVALACLGLISGAAWYWHGLQTAAGLEAGAAEAAADFEFDREADCLRQLIALRPAEPKWRLLAARAARRGGRYADAMNLLDDYQDVQGKATPEGALERAMLFAQTGRLTDVRQQLVAQVDRHHPLEPLLLEALGLGSVQLYQIDEAIDYFDRLLALDEGNVLALLGIAQLFETVNKRGDSVALCEKAVAAHPLNFQARQRLAETLVRDKQFSQALPHLHVLHERAPTDPFVVVLLAQCLRQSGDATKAVELLDECLAHGSTDPELLQERGRLALEAGEAELAEGWLRQAAAAQPTSREANHLYGNCLLRLGRSAEAAPFICKVQSIDSDLKQLEDLYSLVKRKGNDPAPRREIAKLCLRNGQRNEALRWLRGALQLAPSDTATQALMEEAQRAP